MRLETNFLHEATNAQKCADFLANTPELRDKVYVPKVYSEVASSERVMVMEYVKGCRYGKARARRYDTDASTTAG
jgi:aarF domain-containing kinase